MPLWIWQVLGWMLLPSAAVVVLLALLRDRSRGRQRCPKCWYDMKGLATADGRCVCPECGKAVARQTDLHRTRRHWKRALVGAVLALLGFTSMSVPGWNRGWVGVVPSTLLVFIAPPDIPSPGAFGAGLRIGTLGAPVRRAFTGSFPLGAGLTASEKMTDEVWRRLDKEMLGWQRRVFARRLLAASHLRLEDVVQLPDRWVRGEMMPVRIEPRAIRGLDVQASDQWGPIYTSSNQRLPTTGGPSAIIELTISLTSSSGATILSSHRNVSVGLADSWDTLLQPVADAASNLAAQTALSPRIVLVDDKPTVLVRDRGNNPEWNAVGFAMEYTVQVQIGEEVIGRGKGRPEWGKTVWKDWDELDITWSPGAQERLRTQVASIKVTGTGISDPMDYIRNPFNKRAAYWMGEFTVPLKLGPHPGHTEDVQAQPVEK